MKYRKQLAAGFMAAAMLLPVIGAVEIQAKEEKKQVDIMFLHDTHSHLESFSDVDYGDELVGGFAKIKTLIDNQKAKNPDTLVLDAGDFSMGTLVQAIFESEAAEIRMLGALGVEATTLGNHEFDYRSSGLENMLEAAGESGDVLPQMIVSNIDWESMEEAGLSEEQQQLKDAFEAYGSAEYTVITKGDVDIAVFGIFGKDSLAYSPTCVLVFKEPVEAAKEIVAEINENEPEVDMIVCLSHSGTSEKESDSEDEILAKAVPEIDLIVSGHTHTVLNEPIQHGDTYIVSCGEYGKNLGSLSMVETADGVWSMENYELIPVIGDIEENEAITAKIAEFMELVDENYLAQFGYTRDQIVATNEIEFATVEDLGVIHEEHNLGSIMADAYIYGVEHADNFSGDAVDVAVVPSGTVRGSYTKGGITVEEVYNSFSLGIGEDGIPGYPLVEAYLTGEELKIAAEIDASVSDLMTVARLYMSGMNFSYNPNRLILNKVTDCYLTDKDGNRVEIKDDELYHVVTDLYSVQMLGAVTDMSYGILSVVPKFADGTPVEDYADIILMDNGKEIKAWDMIAQYMMSFEDTDGDGIGNVPASYSEKQGRKVVEDSKNIIDLIKNPNRYAVMIVGVIVVLILLVIFIIVLIKKLVRRRRCSR